MHSTIEWVTIFGLVSMLGKILRVYFVLELWIDQQAFTGV